jgi:hypothetical protein
MGSRGRLGIATMALAFGALVVVGSVPAPAPAAADPLPPGFSVTLTVDPTPIRAGRPVTLTATVNNPPPGYLPAHARFLDQDAKVFSQDVPLGDDYRATLRLQPQLSAYKVYVFGSGGYDPWFGAPVPVEVIAGFRVNLSFTTVPAQATPGDPVVVQVRAANGGAVPESTEGGGNVPSGLVSVLSNGNTLGSGPLNGFGRADLPITLPNGPLQIGYEGDDLFVDGSSTPQFVTPPTPDPADPPPVDGTPGPGSTTGDGVDGDATGPGPATTVSPPARPEDERSDLDDDLTGSDSGSDDEAPADDDEVAAAPAGGDADGGAERSSFILGIPSPVMVDWSGAHVVVNLLLALLLMLLVGIPSAIVDNTMEENHDRIVRRFAGEQAAIRRAERRLQDLPDGVLLIGLSVVAALVFAQLDPSIGFNATSGILVLALALIVASVIAVHDLARLPYLNRVVGPPSGTFGVYPFTLMLAALLVVVSRVAGFEPGFVFGLIGSLALKETVTRRDEAITLTGVGIGLLVMAVGAWWLWHPIADRVIEPGPGAGLLFADAFLAGLWLTCIQAVAFGFAPMRFLDGGEVRTWSNAAWFAIQATGMFLLCQFYLHPSAGRWGALDETSMRQALSVFGVFLVGSLLFWAWFRFRPDPLGDVGEPAEPVTVDA